MTRIHVSSHGLLGLIAAIVIACSPAQDPKTMSVTPEMLERAKKAALPLLTEEQQGTGTTCAYETFSETPNEILLTYRRSNPAWIVESHPLIVIVYDKSTGAVAPLHH